MNKTYLRILCLTLTITLVAGCFTTVSFGASKTKKMTVYSNCIKSGKMVYCATGSGVYKVNVKTKGKKKLCGGYNVGCLKLYKGYLYFTNTADSGASNIWRVKTNGKKKKKLANGGRYAIKGKRIYYYGESYDKYGDIKKTFKRSMKRNGKNKKKSKYKVKNTVKKTNKKGYKIVYTYKFDENDNQVVRYYLKTPSKKIYLSSSY